MIRIITTCFGNKFYGAVERLGKQVEGLNLGYIFGVITEETIKSNRKYNWLNNFFEKNKHLKETSRGFFWYIWKPWILLRSLLMIEENDVIIYLDAGTEISIIGAKNLEYLTLQAKNYGSIFFQIPQLINDFTKKECLDFFDTKKYNLTANNVAAGIIFLRNDKETRKLLANWCKLTIHKNGELFKDHGDLNHRHDQSVLSIIIQNYNVQILNYPIWFHPEKYFLKETLNFPIHTLRNSTNVSLLNIYNKFNKVPYSLKTYNKYTKTFILKIIKILFNIKILYRSKIEWNENWHFVFDTIISDNNPQHRTFGDTRQLPFPNDLSFKLHHINKDIIINNYGYFKDLKTNIHYFNHIKQFGGNSNFNKRIGIASIKLSNHISLISLHDNNLFHFIYDLLYKILYLKSIKQNVTCLIKGNQIWKVELMDLFGLNYTILNENESIINNASIIKSPFYSGSPSCEVVEILKREFVLLHNSINYPKRILLFRNKAKSRSVLINKKFQDYFDAHGFTRIELEDYTVLEQIQIFKSAEIIIAGHGAGLSWIINCSANCFIIELFAETYLNFVYATISRKLNLKYKYFICTEDNNRSNFDPDIKLIDNNFQDITTIINNHINI